MKSAIRSIKPYWVFLIIARKMGWDITQEKTIEVGKNQPLAKDWNRKTFIYCSTDKKSFNRIPKEYQPLMRPLLGKVIGEFICDKVEMVNAKCSDYGIDLFYHDCIIKGCLSEREIDKYFNIPEDKDLRVMKGNGYAWHITDLKIYNTPKDISEFVKPYVDYNKPVKDWCHNDCVICDEENCKYDRRLTRPPQSWCYTEAT